MSVTEHRAAAPAHVTCFVLTVSDTRTLENDTSGQAISQLLESGGHAVAGRDVVKDDAAAVQSIVRQQAGRTDIDAIITTGGTGIARRDSTFEALTALFEKRLDGFGELFRMLSFGDIGSAAMLSRATAGVINGRVVFMLPGSEAAVRLAMEKLILPEIAHAVRELRR